MANDSSHFLSPPLDSRGGRGEFASGFTLVELLISVFIITLISIASVVNLSSTRRTEELNSASRVVAADLRDLQVRALSGQNIKSCLDAAVKRAVCEIGAGVCSDPASCAPLPPLGVGAHFDVNHTTYDLFAEVDPSKNDWKKTDGTEVFLTRDLALAGAPNVTIDDVTAAASEPSADISFQRQNGSIGIDACYGPCSSPVTLKIRLRHLQSNKTKTISVNALTGRISIE